MKRVIVLGILGILGCLLGLTETASPQAKPLKLRIDMAGMAHDQAALRQRLEK